MEEGDGGAGGVDGSHVLISEESRGSHVLCVEDDDSDGKRRVVLEYELPKLYHGD